jgi:hypothetical protein
MSDLSLSQRIEQRISESQSPYRPEEHRAELLLRNKQFLEERARIRAPRRRVSSGAGKAKYSRMEFRTEWQNFNYRWWIDGWWDGRDATLRKHVIMKPRVFYRDPKSGRVWILGRDLEHPYACDQRSERGALNIADEGAFIYIKINPWTLKEDLRDLEPMIHKLGKDVFRYSVRDLANFGRDLCWYDLHTQADFGKLSYGRIRIEMRRLHPNQNVPPRKTIIAAIGRIQQFIERLTPIPARFLPRP